VDPESLCNPAVCNGDAPEAGVCAERYCNGDVCDVRPKGTSTQCYSKLGDCDQDTFCNGQDLTCPSPFIPAGTSCRAQNGSPCDAEDFCTGNSIECTDSKRPSTYACRPAQPFCDETEFCTGTSDACPAEDQLNLAETYKCGTTCYLCNINQSQLTLGGKGKSQSYFFTSEASMGSSDTTVSNPFPSCIDAPFPTTCANGRAISNSLSYVCNRQTGVWSLVEKREY
jgi:hypothetical protein